MPPNKRKPGIIGLSTYSSPAYDYSNQVCRDTSLEDLYGICHEKITYPQCRGVIGLSTAVKEKKWSIELIPDIMRANNWIKGAELMEYWFSKKNYTYPDESNTNTGLLPYNDKIITIEWAKQFKSVKEEYDEAWSRKKYALDKVKEYIQSVLEEKKAFSKNHSPFKFGNLSLSVNKINSGDFYVKNIPVSTTSIWSDLNGMAAALANFSFRFAVEGKVTFKKTQETYFGLGDNEDVYTITIEKAGLYIRDSYDFIGSQPLGCWNMKTNKAEKSCIFSGDDFHKVDNSTFREWRKDNSKGGDFLVFSDIEVRTVNESWDIEIKAN